MSRTVHCAEYVSPGHPDRLADAIAEACVQHAIAIDPDALVGVEVAVSTDKVFVTGRIAAGPHGPGDPDEFLPRFARAAYRAAGYGGLWSPDPERLIVTHDLCAEALSQDEREMRHLSDDQAICVGYACGNAGTDYLPPAHWLALRLGEHVRRWREQHAPQTFGPDFKLLPVLQGDNTFPAGHRLTCTWTRLVFSIQHVPGLSYEEQHRLLVPVIRAGCAELEAALPGVARFDSAHLHLNGAGDFSIGGPHGDNGLSGKKLVVDGAGPGVPIGGGAFYGKDPHKADRKGALAARARAVGEVCAGAAEALVTLVYAPGAVEPEAFVERRDAAGLRC